MPDINCTFSCGHQKEGKCTLDAVPTAQSSSLGLCPYLSKPETKKSSRKQKNSDLS